VANLIDTNLASADFENTDLIDVDISGANIYHLKTHGWKIDGIKCTHIYQCDWEARNDPKEREKYRRDFRPGEFEALYKTLPKIELVFQKGFTPQDLSLLTIIVEQINQRLPSPLDMNELKKGMSTNISLTAENNKILKTAIPMIHEMYQKLEEKNEQLRKLMTEKIQFEHRISELVEDKKALMRKIPEPQKHFHKPDIYIENARFNGTSYLSSIHIDHSQYFFSTSDEAEKVAKKVIGHILSSDNVGKTLTEIEQVLSPQLKESPKKKGLLRKAFEKFKGSLDKFPDEVFTANLNLSSLSRPKIAEVKV
jgi:hypothetical protein